MTDESGDVENPDRRRFLGDLGKSVAGVTAGVVARKIADRLPKGSLDQGAVGEVQSVDPETKKDDKDDKSTPPAPDVSEEIKKFDRPVLKESDLGGERRQVECDIVVQNVENGEGIEIPNESCEKVNVFVIERDGKDPIVQVDLDISLLGEGNALDMTTGRQDKGDEPGYRIDSRRFGEFVYERIVSEGQDGTKLSLFFGTDADLNESHANYFFVPGRGDLEDFYAVSKFVYDKSYYDPRSNSLSHSHYEEKLKAVKIEGIGVPMPEYEDVPPSGNDPNNPFNDSQQISA